VFEEDSEKTVEYTWHVVIHKLYLRAWTKFYDKQIRFCDMMVHVKKEDMKGSEAAFTGDVMDMESLGPTLAPLYQSIAPHAASGYVTAVQNLDGSLSLIPVETLQIEVQIGKMATDAYENLKPYVVKYIQQVVDIGTADEAKYNRLTGVMTLILNRSDHAIALWAESIAKLRNIGVHTQNAHYPVVNIEIPKQFEDANAAFKAKGVKYTTTPYKCVIQTSTGNIEIFEPLTTIHPLAVAVDKKEYVPGDDWQQPEAEAPFVTGLPDETAPPQSDGIKVEATPPQSSSTRMRKLTGIIFIAVAYVML
jgi:hypothetical protein